MAAASAKLQHLDHGAEPRARHPRREFVVEGFGGILGGLAMGPRVAVPGGVDTPEDLARVEKILLAR